MAVHKMKVAVIGGGAVGVASASWLLQDGHEVTLIEPGGIAEGASFGNAGCLNASSIVPMSMPGNLMKVPGWLLDPLGPLSIRWGYLPKIAPWLIKFLKAGTLPRVERQAAALKPLLHDAVGAYMPLIRNAGCQHLLRRDGHLVVYRSAADHAGDQLGWRLRSDHGIAFSVLRESALWELEPGLSREYTIGVFLPANGHSTDPNKLIAALATAFVKDGGKVIRARATGFDVEGVELQGIRTDAGLIEADAAVVAAGAHSRPFAAELGDRIPLDTERGYHILVKDPEVVPRIPILDATGKFVSTPMDAGLRLAGTVEFAGLDAAPDWRRARKLLVLGQRLFPGLASSYTDDRLSLWMGFRPSIPDSLPVIGHAKRVPAVVYAFGHGHVGLAAAARTGSIVADMIGGRTPSIPIEPFSPARFA